MPLDPATLPPCLREFTLDQIHAKIEGLADDWFSPTLSPMGLCRTHDIGLAQLRAITALPLFREILADIRFIQDARRADIEQRARDHALDRLSYLAHQTPTSAASCKEIRLATKALLELTAPTVPPTPGGTGVPPVSPPPSSQPVTPQMQSTAPSPSTSNSSSPSGTSVPPVSSAPTSPSPTPPMQSADPCSPTNPAPTLPTTPLPHLTSSA